MYSGEHEGIFHQLETQLKTTGCTYLCISVLKYAINIINEGCLKKEVRPWKKRYPDSLLHHLFPFPFQYLERKRSNNRVPFSTEKEVALNKA